MNQFTLDRHRGTNDLVPRYELPWNEEQETIIANHGIGQPARVTSLV